MTSFLLSHLLFYKSAVVPCYDNPCRAGAQDIYSCQDGPKVSPHGLTWIAINIPKIAGLGISPQNHPSWIKTLSSCSLGDHVYEMANATDSYSNQSTGSNLLALLAWITDWVPGLFLLLQTDPQSTGMSVGSNISWDLSIFILQNTQWAVYKYMSLTFYAIIVLQ